MAWFIWAWLGLFGLGLPASGRAKHITTGDCVREVVVVVLVACPRDHRRHVFVPHATNRKTPSKMSIRTKELETMAGKKKVGEAQRVFETWGTKR